MWAYVYMDSWIRCRVDLYAFFCFCFFFLFVCFFSDILTYCVMLQAFLCYCSFVRCFWCARVCVCVCVCVLFIGIVQRNWACLTWKSALEIKSLLLLLLLLMFNSPLPQPLTHPPLFLSLPLSLCPSHSLSLSPSKQKECKKVGTMRKNHTVTAQVIPCFPVQLVPLHLRVPYLHL